MRRLFALCALFLLLSACGKEPESQPSLNTVPIPTMTPLPTSTPMPEPTPEPTPGPKEINPLTGLRMEESAYGNRPVAIMMNNLKAALPMYGQSQADIIYEVLAEGGITRMLAVFQDPSKVPQIGTVRSARPYYLDLAQGHDALFLHAGGSVDGYAQIKSRKIDNLDGVNGPYEGSLYYRDKARIKSVGLEHSMFTSGERIVSTLETLKARKTLRTGFEQGWKFSEDAEIKDGTPAATITVKYSSYKTGVFEYDAEKARYLVSEYGKPYVDGETGNQVEIDNVLGIYAEMGVIKGDTYGCMYAKLVGEGTGFYANGGISSPITWTKTSYDSPFVFMTTDGKPLVMLPGKNYINILQLKTVVEME